MQVQPYLFLEGRCDEAIEFYRKTLGAEVEMLLRTKDSPEPPPPGRLPPGSEEKVMHAAIRIGDTTLFLSDGLSSGQPKFEGFSLSLAVPSEAEAERVFAALAEGGEVRQPLMKTFFSPRFGMLADRFGLPWMIIVPQ
jgi:PhnB protein